MRGVRCGALHFLLLVGQSFKQREFLLLARTSPGGENGRGADGHASRFEVGREADAARSGAGVTTCCPPRLTQPLLCATHCWGGVSTVGRGQTRCLSRSVAWLRGQRVTTQSPSPMVSKGSNLEEENESGGVFNKYSAANLEATGRSETRRRRVPAARRVPSASTGRRLGPPLPRAAEAAPSHAAKRLRTHAL